MKSITILAWALLLGALPATAAAQTGFRIVVNPANHIASLKAADASKIFLRKWPKWATGQAVVVVDQVESSPVRKAFSQAIHGMDVPSVKSYWQELVFSGKGTAPAEKGSDAEVIAFVKANPDAVGYVAPDAAGLAEVKVVPLTP